ncbi:MAG: hypothetical protein GH151_00010 [Bacteroidetes bacterium]|nr:hypothetical protein [Bacteroidota bacterium]
MPGPDQKIKTVLIPESGLDLSPEFIEQSIVTPDFSRVFAHLIGKADDRGILIRATSDGSLKVVSSGVPFESYLVYPGTCDVDHDVYDTEEFEVAYNVTDFLIEAHDVLISFRNSQGVWLQDKVLLAGYHSIDFIHYGFRIRNRVNTEDPDYEITIYR